jgi:prepilin-type N-terminal cleavage/methylation domain-containing protein
VNRPTRQTSRSRRTAGFTLIELMVVVTIISIVAVLAIPSMSHEGYDRRAFTDAANIAEVVREARTRAIGRGAAILLTMVTNSAQNAASFMMYEAVSANPVGGGANIPSASCDAPTVWPTGAAGTATANFIDGFSFAGTVSGAQTLEGLGGIAARINNPDGTQVSDGTTVYLCFTPSGRVRYVNTGTPTGFSTAVIAGTYGAVTVDVVRGGFPATFGGPVSTGLVRTIWIPPSGATRITSE